MEHHAQYSNDEHREKLIEPLLALPEQSNVDGSAQEAAKKILLDYFTTEQFNIYNFLHEYFNPDKPRDGSFSTVKEQKERIDRLLKIKKEAFSRRSMSV
ncbi:MAG: hypothetical protein LBQ33_03065 [Oscillospiraceae bacterium]|jgi:hypothetical protein|nr:hypothetical protein [Oscillospiraceae bacterium]